MPVKFNSLFFKIVASVTLALCVFAAAMMLLTHLVHDTSDKTRHQIIATQVTQQLEPLLVELRVAQDQRQYLESRYLMALIRRSFSLYGDSLNAKFALYDEQTQDALLAMPGLPPHLPPQPPWFRALFPFDEPKHPLDVQIASPSGYVLLYQANTPAQSPFAPFLNLFTGTLLLLLIMSAAIWILTRTLTNRIDELSQQMVKLGAGDFSARVKPTGDDELTLLARGFNQTAERIETLMNANKLLLAHASHEIRTPITRIRLQVEMMGMLASQLDATAQQKFAKRADAINRDLTGLNDLVESILLVSRMDAGHAIEQVEVIDLYDLIKSEVQHYAGATLVGHHLTIEGQKSLLTHMVRNLLDNAYLHGVPPAQVQLYTLDDTGQPLITAEPLLTLPDHDTQTHDSTDTTPTDMPSNAHHTDTPNAASELAQDNKINQTAKDPQESKNPDKPKSPRFSRKKPAPVTYPFVQIAVIDQGAGIPIEKRADVFSPFVRLQQDKKGSGLGLSLVAQIAAAHNGTIITDTLDGHTRFLITLPVRQVRAS